MGTEFVSEIALQFAEAPIPPEPIPVPSPGISEKVISGIQTGDPLIIFMVAFCVIFFLALIYFFVWAGKFAYRKKYISYFFRPSCIVGKHVAM